MRICKKCFREIGEYPFCPYCGASQKSNLLTLEKIKIRIIFLAFVVCMCYSKSTQCFAWTFPILETVISSPAPRIYRG